MVGKPPFKHLLWGPRREGIFSKPFPSETRSSNISHRWNCFKKKHPIPTSNLLLTYSRFPPPPNQTKKQTNTSHTTYLQKTSKNYTSQLPNPPTKTRHPNQTAPICCHPAISCHPLPDHRRKSPSHRRFPMNIRELDLTVDTLDGGTELINQVRGKQGCNWGNARH